MNGCPEYTPHLTMLNLQSFHISSPTLISLSLSQVSKKFTMAAMHSHVFSSTISHYPQRHLSPAGFMSLPSVVCRSAYSSFHGHSLQLHHQRGLRQTRIGVISQVSRTIAMMVKPAIQFIQGTNEQTIPDVRLTKSRDGTNGVATFIFEQPSVFDSSSELGDITGFYMIDEEGMLQSVDVNAKFVNGKPARIEAKYIMRSPREWDRFMRFMERYSNENGLQFIKK